jgi:hypothetical protein
MMQSLSGHYKFSEPNVVVILPWISLHELDRGMTSIPGVMAVLWVDSFVELHNEILSTSDIIYTMT